MKKYSFKTILFLVLWIISNNLLYSQNPTHEDLNELFQEGKYPEALLLAKKLSIQYKEKVGTQNVTYLSIREKEAYLNTIMGNYLEGEAIYKEVIDTRKELSGESHEKFADDLNGIAALYRQTERYKESEKYYQWALRLRQKYRGAQHKDYASSLNSLGLLYYDMGLYAKAVTLYSQSYRVYQNLLPSEFGGYTSVLNNLALLYTHTGKFELAEDMYKKALSVKKKNLGTQHPSYATTLFNLGILYQQAGSFGSAERLFHKVSAIYKKNYGENHPEYASVLAGIADLYINVGRPKEAFALLTKADAIYKVSNQTNSKEYAAFLSQLGDFYVKSESYEKAEECFIQSLELRFKLLGENHLQYSISLSKLGALYGKREVRRYEEAEQMLSDALVIKEVHYGIYNPQYTIGLNSLARIQTRMGKFEEAKTNFLNCLELKLKVYGKDHPSTYQTEFDLACCLTSMKEYEEAAKHYISSIRYRSMDILLQFDGLSEKEKEQYFNAYKSDFDVFLSFSQQYGTHYPGVADALWESRLLTKSLLLKTGNRIKNQMYENGDSVLIQSYTQWLELKEEIAKVFVTNVDPMYRKHQIDSLMVLSDRLEKNISAKSEVFVQSQIKLPKAHDLYTKIGKHEALVDIVKWTSYCFDSLGYFLPVERYSAYISIPSQNKNKLIELGTAPNLEHKNFTYYRNAIDFKVEDLHSYSIYWKPIEETLHGIGTLFLSVDGIYHRIQVAGLYAPESDQFVVDKHELCLLSSVSDLLHTSKVIHSREKTAVLIGNPTYDSIPSEETLLTYFMSTPDPIIERGSVLVELPGTQKELDTIASLLTEKNIYITLLDRQYATEGALKRLKTPTILHIATHGFFEPDGEGFPLLRSGILLAGANESLEKKQNGMPTFGEDGIVTAYELSSMNFRGTELVVLSACETGLGDIENGEGVMGLQRAFLIAGASNCIMSLWKVNDQTTQELMVLFYKHWLSGFNSSKQHAFRKAQLELREKYPHPYYWAAFALHGL